MSIFMLHDSLVYMSFPPSMIIMVRSINKTYSEHFNDVQQIAIISTSRLLKC